MSSTPAVLSVGLRIKQGYSFIWLHGKQPCMIRPEGHVVILDARGDIPYLRRDLKHRDPSMQAKAEEACGVLSTEDALHIQHPHAGA